MCFCRTCRRLNEKQLCRTWDTVGMWDVCIRVYWFDWIVHQVIISENDHDVMCWQVDSGWAWIRKVLLGPSPGLGSFLGFWPALLSLLMPFSQRRWCQQWMATSGDCLTTTTSMPASCSCRSSLFSGIWVVSFTSTTFLTSGSGPRWPLEAYSVSPSDTSLAFKSSTPVPSHTTCRGRQRPAGRPSSPWWSTTPVKPCSGGPVTCWFSLALRPTRGSEVEKWRKHPQKSPRTMKEKRCWMKLRKVTGQFNQDKICEITLHLKKKNIFESMVMLSLGFFFFYVA